MTSFSRAATSLAQVSGQTTALADALRRFPSTLTGQPQTGEPARRAAQNVSWTSWAAAASRAFIVLLGVSSPARTMPWASTVATPTSIVADPLVPSGGGVSTLPSSSTAGALSRRTLTAATTANASQGAGFGSDAA